MLIARGESDFVPILWVRLHLVELDSKIDPGVSLFYHQRKSRAVVVEMRRTSRNITIKIAFTPHNSFFGI